MTTKNQERKALEQIRKIVESLDEDSYIGTAFEGCFEIAQENIDNDWACSMKDRAESAELKAECLDELNQKLNAQIKKAEDEITQKDLTIAALGERIDAHIKNNLTLNDQIHQQMGTIKGLEEENKDLCNEIIVLKAKLYDLIVKED